MFAQHASHLKFLNDFLSLDFFDVHFSASKLSWPLNWKSKFEEIFYVGEGIEARMMCPCLLCSMTGKCNNLLLLVAF